MSELFSRVENLRVKKHATYRQIAAFCGVSPQNVQRWKAGGTIMPEHLQRLSEFFNTSLDYLMNGKVNAVQPQCISEPKTVEYDTKKTVEGCPACSVKDKEIIFLRDLLTRCQENFSSALAAIERNKKP